MAEETLYDVLGLPRDATPEEIRHSYRDMARRLHPDHNVNLGETELFIGVQEAFEVLSDPDRKKNYDLGLPPEPLMIPPISVQITYSRNSLARMSEPQLFYAMVELRVHADAEHPPTSPINLCLVLDCSTSMQGVRLDTVKSTAIDLVRQLQSEDILSIVKFSDRAEVIVPAGSRADRRSVETRIQVLQAGGGTEILQGLALGFEEIRRYCSPNRISHIILITDGRTYGDEEACIRLADQASSYGISISALGIGSQWNDKFLDEMVSRTGGNCKYVSRAEDIRRFILEKINGFEHSFAENATYTFSTPENVFLNYAFRLHPDTSPLVTGSPLVLGSIPRDSNHNLLLEFLANDVPPKADHLTLCKGRLTYEVPSSTKKRKFVHRLDIATMITDEFDLEPPPPNLMQAMSRLTLYRMQERAREDIGDGNMRDATRRLQNLATHLLAQGQRDLARSVLGEVAHIQQNQTFSEEGDKRIKYGTRALLLPPGTKEKQHDRVS